MKILLVEDDLSLINGLSYAIERQGFELNIARTVSEINRIWQDKKYDLVILDVSLLDGTGYDICEKIRMSSKVSVVFLTSADEETDIIKGLDLGADDYITKPFKLAVLISKINAILRRLNNFSQSGIELVSNNIKVDLLKGTVYIRRLQAKIEDNPSEPEMIITVLRMGYKWSVRQ